jgi:hypothetical protein
MKLEAKTRLIATSVQAATLDESVRYLQDHFTSKGVRVTTKKHGKDIDVDFGDPNRPNKDDYNFIVRLSLVGKKVYVEVVDSGWTHPYLYKSAPVEMTSFVAKFRSKVNKHQYVSVGMGRKSAERREKALFAVVNAFIALTKMSELKRS